MRRANQVSTVHMSTVPYIMNTPGQTCRQLIFEADSPVRILTVTGRGEPAAMPATSRASFAGLRRSTAPKPLREASARAWLSQLDDRLELNVDAIEDECCSPLRNVSLKTSWTHLRDQ